MSYRKAAGKNAGRRCHQLRGRGLSCVHPLQHGGRAAGRGRGMHAVYVSLYGFADRESQAMFRLLTGVSGVGPRVALAILSALSPQRIVLAASSGDHKSFTAANGVGPKLAQRIVLELRDKVGKALGGALTADALPGAAAAPAGSVAQAVAALTSLGYAGALAGLDASLPTPELIRLALQGIGKRGK